MLEWRPIETHRFDDDLPVLVYEPRGKSGWITRARKWRGQWVVGDLPGEEIFPTHWMPLPEPPEEE